MNFFDIIAKGDRIVVFADEETREIYTWNHSLTLQVWRYQSLEVCEEIDAMTFADIPSLEDVCKRVKRWHKERWN